MWSTVPILVLMIFTAAWAQNFKEPQTFINDLKFTDPNFKDAFAALDVDKKYNLITTKDLDVLFHHEDGKFAKEKFLRMVNIKNDGVTIKELAIFMNTEPVKLATHECIYVKSRALRRLCFGDQILTYVYLVLDQEAVSILFRALDSKVKDQKLDIAEIEALKEYDEKFNTEAAKNFLKEIGRGHDTIDDQAFGNYVKREDLNGRFRGCIKNPTKPSTYDQSCLIKALMRYTMYDVTEVMTALVFININKDVEDFALSKKDLESTFGTDAEAQKNIDRFFEIFDYATDKKVTYGEFRCYVHSHSVKLFMERACLRGKQIDSWENNIDCLKKTMWTLIIENHRPMMMSVPDLDMLFLFEDLDRNNNGNIDMEDDLVKSLKWNNKKAQKFIEEINESDRLRSEEDNFVTLDEFNYYVDEPNMVYGLGDCLIKPSGGDRLKCYFSELEKMIESILGKTEVTDFRRFYDISEKTAITREKLIAVHMENEDEIDNFLLELGMGDETVTEWEFTWFVKQQELSEKFKPEIRDNQWELHTELLSYLNNVMTEYDTQLLFGRLDVNHNSELDREDFKNVDAANMIRNMNFLDSSGRVSFLEFWLFLNTPSKLDVTKLRKRTLETDCTQKHKLQTDELNCYQENINIVQ